MKFLILLVLIVAKLPFKGYAQLFGNQDKKMIQNNTAQISLLKTYSDYLDKGLTIAHDGMDLTHSLKNGEFGLHSLYYSSLLQVNPNVKKYPLAGQTLNLYAKMEKLETSIYNNVLSTDMLSTQEKQSLKTFVNNLMTMAGKDMEELNNLLTDGKYQLTDDERMKTMDMVNKRIVGKYNALHLTEKRINTIISGRKQQKTNTSKLRQLYGIP
ncbi:hypothetical protein [Rhizosphaericola mali]|uniref:TerB family tellurite resistance protein n=1 Tax=Rhizosphaericola mali TaxID=2545455 RepID=A0A5P2G6R5_9BACT|nr:hypothetical protein [Rhizosphaericola mali]QES88923.1 hypothetical protein E0W69_009725 [Rhizosphaericola mali]